MCISNMPYICIAFSILLGDQGWVMMVMRDVSQCSLCARYFTRVTHFSLSCDLVFPNSLIQDQKDSERNEAGNKKAGV